MLACSTGNPRRVFMLMLSAHCLASSIGFMTQTPLTMIE
jgi:hypothetical protein